MIQPTLDQLDDKSFIKTCTLSKDMRSLCESYLPIRSKERFGEVINTIPEYIKLLTQRGNVLEGSEQFVPLDEAIYRASIIGDRDLINYFLRQSPEANQGCDSKHVGLVLIGTLLGKHQDIANEILRHCKLVATLQDFIHKLGLKLGMAFPTPDPNELKHARWVNEVYPLDTYDSLSLIEKLDKMDLIPETDRILVIRGHVAKNHPDIVKYFVEPSYDLDPYILLVVAAEFGLLDMLKYLRNKYPSAELQGALKHAENLEIVKYLLEQDPTLNLEEALDEAIYAEDLERVKYLVENGAEVTSDIVQSSYNPEVRKYLKEILVESL